MHGWTPLPKLCDTLLDNMKPYLCIPRMWKPEYQDGNGEYPVGGEKAKVSAKGCSHPGNPDLLLPGHIAGGFAVCLQVDRAHSAEPNMAPRPLL